ncbi:hypothetical protein O7627_23960 [Solwaraspora sp. WMMD1047]|uniref:hypothetical protein n=1 Tax=Solwaraspora sp. WMMD1047 TaxID=3016102 RepID=UPI0024163B70|nr:hypothetical protein [Solwaraspora sp. WMMD1047]MDG4832339.1 hypothetical protein [Solwaraspora sp. WMMD1047]
MTRRITKKSMLAGLAAAGVLSVGIAAPTVAFAQDEAEPTPSATADADPGQAGEQRRAEHLTELAEALATELGVSADDVKAAMEKVREEIGGPDGERPMNGENREARLREKLDAAVADGTLTQAEADAVLKAYQEGVLPGPGRGGGPMGGPGRPAGPADGE